MDDEEKPAIQDLLARLRKSRFRARFHLDHAARGYLAQRGMDAIMDHAAAFIRMRLAPMHLPNDGKQTPMRGHPVFIAQHATASCCRSCLRKWHGLPKDVLLDAAQQRAILDVIRAWLMREIDQPASCVRQGSPPQGELF